MKDLSKILECLYDLSDSIEDSRNRPKDQFDRGWNAACNHVNTDIMACIQNLEELLPESEDE